MKKETIISFIADAVIFTIVLGVSDLIMDLFGFEGFWLHLLCMLVLYILIKGIYEWIVMSLARKICK